MALKDHSEVEELVQELLKSIQATLGTELKALYLYGSLVGGDFKIESSDIDLVAIVENPITDSQLLKLETMHDTFVTKHPKWNDRVEVAYMSVDAMRTFKTTKSEVAIISPGEPLHIKEAGVHWLMDWFMVQEQGETIYGPPPNTFIPRITRKEYIAEVKDHVVMTRDWMHDSMAEHYDADTILNWVYRRV